MSWLYKNKKFTDPGDYYGFTYIIFDDQGRWYGGKKAFSHRKKTKLSKKARVGTRKKINISFIDSQWQEYWGSCKPLLEYIKTKENTEGFKRIILKLCKDRSSLNYWETHYLITKNAIFDENCWNSNIGGRYFRGKIHK